MCYSRPPELGIGASEACRVGIANLLVGLSALSHRTMLYTESCAVVLKDGDFDQSVLGFDRCDEIRSEGLMCMGGVCGGGDDDNLGLHSCGNAPRNVSRTVQ